MCVNTLLLITRQMPKQFQCKELAHLTSFTDKHTFVNRSCCHFNASVQSRSHTIHSIPSCSVIHGAVTNTCPIITVTLIRSCQDGAPYYYICVSQSYLMCVIFHNFFFLQNTENIIWCLTQRLCPSLYKGDLTMECVSWSDKSV